MSLIPSHGVTGQSSGAKTNSTDSSNLLRPFDKSQQKQHLMRFAISLIVTLGALFLFFAVHEILPSRTNVISTSLGEIGGNLLTVPILAFGPMFIFASGCDIYLSHDMRRKFRSITKQHLDPLFGMMFNQMPEELKNSQEFQNAWQIEKEIFFDKIANSDYQSVENVVLIFFNEVKNRLPSNLANLLSDHLEKTDYTEFSSALIPTLSSNASTALVSNQSTALVKV